MGSTAAVVYPLGTGRGDTVRPGYRLSRGWEGQITTA